MNPTIAPQRKYEEYLTEENNTWVSSVFRQESDPQSPTEFLCELLLFLFPNLPSEGLHKEQDASGRINSENCKRNARFIRQVLRFYKLRQPENYSFLLYRFETKQKREKEDLSGTLNCIITGLTEYFNQNAFKQRISNTLQIRQQHVEDTSQLAIRRAANFKKDMAELESILAAAQGNEAVRQKLEDLITETKRKVGEVLSTQS